MKAFTISKNNASALPTVVLLMASLGLIACGEKISPEEATKQRVLERWEIRKAGKVDGLYAFLSTAQKDNVSQSVYEHSEKTSDKYMSATIQSIDCGASDKKTAGICEVDLQVVVEQDNELISIPWHETWKNDDGQWLIQIPKAKDNVSKQAKTFWQHRIDNNISGLYRFVSPAKRQLVSKSNYERRFGSALKYLEAQVKSVNCQKTTEQIIDLCEVEMDILMRRTIEGYPTIPATLKEQWVYEGGRWWKNID